MVPYFTSLKGGASFSILEWSEVNDLGYPSCFKSAYCVPGIVVGTEDREVNIKMSLKFNAAIKKNEVYLYVLMWKNI